MKTPNIKYNNDVSSAEKRLSHLTKILKNAQESYYNDDDPSISDGEYDKLLLEYKNIEKEFPSLLDSGSLSQKVGAKPSSKFKKVSHQKAMLSLSNAFEENDLAEFDLRIKKFLNIDLKETLEYTVEPKIDGVSLSLLYEDGNLIRAATRGDGQEGEDVTQNALVIQEIPSKLNFSGVKIPQSFEVRGEVFITKHDFNLLNISQEKNNLKLFTNPTQNSTLRGLFPVFYADLWGDYNMYFSYLDYKFNGKNLKFENYLGRVNFISIYPSVLILFGLVKLSTEFISKKTDIVSIIKKVETSYALIVNPDVTLNNDAVNKFFLSINNLGDFGIIAPISQNEKYNNFNINEDKEIKEVDNVKGFAMFLNMKNLKQINFFDDNFFLYFEEIDLCRRLKKNNSKIFIDPTIKVSHLGGTSHNSEIEKPMELSRNWHWMWSTFYFHKKHYGYLTAMIKILPKLSSSLIKFIIFLITFQKYKSEIYKHRLSGIINSVLLKKSWYRPKL